MHLKWTYEGILLKSDLGKGELPFKTIIHLGI